MFQKICALLSKNWWPYGLVLVCGRLRVLGVNGPYRISCLQSKGEDTRISGNAWQLPVTKLIYPRHPLQWPSHCNNITTLTRRCTHSRIDLSSRYLALLLFSVLLACLFLYLRRTWSLVHTDMMCTRWPCIIYSFQSPLSSQTPWLRSYIIFKSIRLSILLIWMGDDASPYSRCLLSEFPASSLNTRSQKYCSSHFIKDLEFW